ncbi:STAS domain-containing protein [Saccharothrix sp. ALI-22-I]|uniref:STAS domain-containing protein n=1 Tax=Saccharothrix sp. ALI-22-I TaxID=1933778 RepID=UPI003FD2C138
MVLTARGEVDMASAPYLRDRLQGEIHHAGPDLIANLNDVSFFGAAGLDVLADVREAASLAESGFCVVARTRKILMPLRVTGVGLGARRLPRPRPHPHAALVPDRTSVAHLRERPS